MNIYKLVNLKNGMVYIGRSNKSVEKAMEAHRYEGNQTNPSRPIGQAIKKFGLDNFQFELLETCDDNQATARYKYWMAQFDSQGENGYNRKHTGGKAVSREDVLKLYAQNLSAREIAAQLHCDERTVVSHVKASNANPEAKDITKAAGRVSSEGAIMKLWEEGMNHLDIANELGLSKARVHTILRKNGVELAELYQRRNVPMPLPTRQYYYSQVDENENILEIPDVSGIIAPMHNICRTSLINACLGPATHAKGEMFRRYNTDGEMMPRVCEPVGRNIPVIATNADNPEIVQEFESITAATVAMCGSKDTTVMQRIRTAAKLHKMYYGMYWNVDDSHHVNTRNQKIYAFSVEDYNQRMAFDTQGEAARALHVHQNGISRHLHYPQRYHSVGGYILSWDENFSYEEWSKLAYFARPEHARCKQAQTKQQDIYLTKIDKYDITYCSTLLDAVDVTKGTANDISKCLRGDVQKTKTYFVSSYPLTYSEWEERKQTLVISKNCKSVYGVSIESNSMIIANSIREAAEAASVTRESISYALRNNNACAGYRWYYGIPARTLSTPSKNKSC